MDFVARSDKVSVLNETTKNISVVDSGSIAAEIKNVLDKIYADGISMDGYSVDYKRLKSSTAYQKFQEEYYPKLRGFDPTKLVSREEKLAFWINIYNALVIDGVITSSIRESVREGTLGGMSFFQKTAYNIGGYNFNLNDIEHGILRANRGFPYLPGKQFGQPRLLMLNPQTGYQGFPGGIVFGPGCRQTVLQL